MWKKRVGVGLLLLFCFVVVPSDKRVLFAVDLFSDVVHENVLVEKTYPVVHVSGDKRISGGSYHQRGQTGQIYLEAGDKLTIEGSGGTNGILCVGNGVYLDSRGTIDVNDGGIVTTEEGSGGFIGMVRFVFNNRTGGIFNFNDGSTYSVLERQDFINHGIVNIHDMTSGSAQNLLSSMSMMNGGIVNLYTAIDGFKLNNNVGAHDYDGTVVLKNANSVFTDTIDVRTSRLDASEVGGEFYGSVISGRNEEGSLKTGKTTNFYSGVYGHLDVVDGVTTFKQGSSYNIGQYYNYAAWSGPQHQDIDESNLRVYTGATLVNETDLNLDRSFNMAIVNQGTFNNAGSLTAGGGEKSGLDRYSSVENMAGGVINNSGTMSFLAGRTWSANILQNDGIFNNTGTLILDGDDRTRYSGTGTIDNKGVMTVSSEIRGMSELLQATTLSTALSELNINYHGGGENWSLADSVAGSNINIDSSIASTSTWTYGLDGFDAKNSNINVRSGLLRLSGGSVQTTGGINILSGATAYIYNSSTVEAGAGITVNGTINIANRTILNVVAPTTTFTAMSQFSTGSSGTMQVDGNLEVVEGARLTVASSTTLDSLKNNTFVAATGTFAGNFVNDRYNFVVADTAQGKALILDDGKPTNSINEIVEQNTGTGIQDSSTLATAEYVDNYLNTADSESQAKVVLDELVQNISQVGTAALTQILREQSGEAAVYSSAPLKHTIDRFFKSLDSRLDGYWRFRNVNDYASASGGSDNATASVQANASYQGKTLWASGFGNWNKQKARDNSLGYQYDSYGAILGFEKWCDRLSFGFAGAYSNGELEIDGVSATTDVETMSLAAYAGYFHDSGMYAKGVLGFSNSWNDSNVGSSLGGTKTGSYDSQAYSASLEAGYTFALPANVNITPFVGAMYSHIRQDGWTEDNTNSNAVANWFSSSRDDILEIPVGLRIGKSFNIANIGCIIPEVKAAWIYSATDPQESIRTGLVGSSSSMTVYGAKASRSRLALGAGVTGKFVDSVDVSLNYNYETRSKYHNHNVTASIGYSF